MQDESRDIDELIDALGKIVGYCPYDKSALRYAVNSIRVTAPSVASQLEKLEEEGRETWRKMMVKYRNYDPSHTDGKVGEWTPKYD